MVCYAVPSAVAVLGFIARKKYKWNDKYSAWFNIMFSGGALFGIVDHLWNGELFLISENFVMDILLGITITAVIFATWVVFVQVDKARTVKLART